MSPKHGHLLSMISHMQIRAALHIITCRVEVLNDCPQSFTLTLLHPSAPLVIMRSCPLPATASEFCTTFNKKILRVYRVQAFSGLHGFQFFVAHRQGRRYRSGSFAALYFQLRETTMDQEPHDLSQPPFIPFTLFKCPRTLLNSTLVPSLPHTCNNKTQ